MVQYKINRLINDGRKFYSKTINLILFVFFFLLSTIDLKCQSILFNHLTTNNGLSNNFVSDIIQDKYGFLWFATDDGLNRFDGYEFKVYRNNPSDKNSLSDNTVISFASDAKGNIWMGTKNGFVNCYDPELNKFTSWEIKSDITKDNPITTLYIDRSKHVWIGTYRSGLFRLDPKTGKIDHWLAEAKNPKSLSSNYVSSIAEDESGNFWIGTFYGLNKIDPNKTPIEFERFYKEDNNWSISNNLVWNITKSTLDNDKLFIGTADGLTILQARKNKFERVSISNPDNIQFGTGLGYVVEEDINGEHILWMNSFAGLLRYNVSQRKFNRYLPDKLNANSIISAQINKIFKDHSGVLWIATNKGLSYFTQKNNKFNSSFLSGQFDFESNNIIHLNTTAVLKPTNDKLFIGTDKGLFFSDHTGEKIKFKKHTRLDKQNIWSLTKDKNDNVWIGTYGQGLFQLNLKNNKVIHHDILKSITISPSRNFIKSLLIDDDNNLWIGTWGVGLVKFNLSDKKLTHYLHKPDNNKSISHDDVWVIFKDSKNRLWFGTNGGGLNLFVNKNSGEFFRFNSDKNKNLHINSNSIYSMCESGATHNSDQETILWIGTNKGLYKVCIDDANSLPSSIKIKSLINYTTKDGLADNSIKTIVEDSDGNLWLGTSTGISFFHVLKNTFTNFNSADGVIGNDFNFSSGLMYDKDLIILGSTSGLNYINPNSIKLSDYFPAVVISDFQIFNKSIIPDKNSVLTKNICATNKIVLSYTQNVFSFLFSALDYNNPNSISYAYMMEGFDKDWIQSNSRRFITYTNLNPGNYTFKVKATNSDGIWSSKITSLKVEITPPWWQTIWAIALYFLVFVFGIYGIFRFQSNRAKLQHELKMREFEAYHLKEVEQMKSRFFANISHEFRTPLLLIKGPLQSLINGTIKDSLSDYYTMILRNTEKLQTLIDQLLELSQLESESIPLKLDSYNLIEIVKSCYNSFKSLADEKNINYKFSSDQQKHFVMLDKDKLEKIINNLLSNSFKFTPNGGSVRVDIYLSQKGGNQFICVSVKDSGIGIPEEYLPKIFNRFYQVESSSKRNYSGSGIGLSLVKELTALHKWNIDVESIEGKGTEFILSIPLKEKNIEVKNNITESIDTKVDNTIDPIVPYLNVSASSNNIEKPVILIVEDNDDVRIYVKDLLISDYNILLAESGEAGIEVTKNDLPDLIISDIMMPGMDGFEFCKRIKSDWKTSHIPVILLTAKVDHQSKLDGLELGADDYITKPFEQQELLIRIKNLIEQRKQLKEKYSKTISLQTESSNSTEENELIKKASSVIENHLGDENFNSEVLAKEVFMSRSQLTRKMQSVIGQGPGEFIRNYKLNRAAQMIIENKLSITQIALEVGFGSPSQFTRAFQKHFNCLPSEFKSL